MQLIKQNKQLVFRALGICVLIAAGLGIWQFSSKTSPASVAQFANEFDPALGYVAGSADAPVTMIEFASLTCPHCRAFHDDVLPKLKRDYIDSGKVKLIYRHFPLDALAMAASMQVDCLPPDARELAVSALFQSQNQWAAAPDKAAAIYRIFQQFGVSRKVFNECLQNQELRNAINADLTNASENHGVRSTPSFFINNKPIAGAQNYAVFAELIENALDQ